MSSGVSGDGGMKILCLYNNDCALELFAWLEAQGHDVILCSDKLEADWCEKQGFDLAVSYTYRYILSSDILESLGNNVVNIHNSVLPWNRGADPNLAAGEIPGSGPRAGGVEEAAGGGEKTDAANARTDEGQQPSGGEIPRPERRDHPETEGVGPSVRRGDE